MVLYPPDSERTRTVLLTEVRLLAPTLPIVAITTTVASELRAGLRRFGVAAILPASSTARDIVRTIRETLARATPGSCP
jgi:hypothetical protein